jgi:hypothetical protein
MLWTGSDPRAAALVVPTVEVISGQSEFMIPCTATAAAADAVRSYYWLFNGTFVHAGAAGTSVRVDGGLQFSEIRPEQTGNRHFGTCRYIIATIVCKKAFKNSNLGSLSLASNAY